LEALSMLAEHGEDARLLAGGQSLVPLMNLRMGRPKVLIDLNRCADLAYIEKRADHVAYGAMARQIDAQLSPVTLAHCPLVAKALALAGPPAVRNRATVGGTLAHADRTAELPCVAAALDATFVIEGPAGPRETPAASFFVADLATDIQPGEMLREVRFPLCSPQAFSAFAEVGVRRRDMALAGLAAHLELGADRVCRKAALAVIGVEARPVRLGELERQLVARPLSAPLIAQLARQAAAAVEPLSDVHATQRYRRHAVSSLVAQVLEQALHAS
jgi:carbon-monoxide dehydrogenase medium subunit